MSTPPFTDPFCYVTCALCGDNVTSWGCGVIDGAYYCDIQSNPCELSCYEKVYKRPEQIAKTK